jgi:5-methyltetrahydrofolate--homocysteine methyltransferase
MATTIDAGTRAGAGTGSRYLDELDKRVLIFDGAMGTSVQSYYLDAEAFGGPGLEGCNEHLVLTRPDIIEEIHESFLKVGCDVLETDSFQGSRLKLDEWGLGAKTHEINRAAARIARRVADRYSTPDRPRFVAGSIGPTGMLPSADDPALSKITYAELVEIFYEQARALAEGGADLMIVETMVDILELKAAITAINRLSRDLGRRIPIQAQVFFDVSGRMLLGTDIEAVMTTLEALPGVDIIGLNCGTGPEHMREPIRWLGEHCRARISVIPNAGIPLNVEDKAVFPLGPDEMAKDLARFVHEFGVSVVGGCCGTTPAHLERIVAAVGVRPPKERQVEHRPRVSSGVHAATLHQDPGPLLVGERVNATGSRKVKRLLLADDYDGVLAVAREQLDSGAHVLDVSVAMTERADEVEQMRAVVKKLAMGVELPLVLDSTEADVLRAALEIYPGRAIVNSINMEDGRGRIERVAPLLVEHGAATVALTIDEEGMAKTAARKLEVARKIHDIVVGEYGLPPDALLFDALTFPLTTGDPEFAPSAVETIEGIRAIKRELPGVLTILGVSNLSFGITPAVRGVLNSVFLYHAVAAGLDAAIINPAHVTPYAEIDAEQRELMEDLVFNRRPDALARVIQFYEEHAPAQAADRPEGTRDPTAGLTTDQKIHYQILHRKKEGVERQVDLAIGERVGRPAPEALEQDGAAATNDAAVALLNAVLLPAMKEVGDKFGAGELILPFVLQSAEVMKKAVGQMERYLEKQEGYTKGKVVLATVYGDVHDIGKNLVNTILSNNGYTVYDLGKQVPLNTIIDKAVEVGADAIGLSALLVSTSKQMPLCVKELHGRGLAFPVIVGGAAINRGYGRRILFVEEGKPYEPGLFYAQDAFEGLQIMDTLADPDRREPFRRRIIEEAVVAQGKAAARGASGVERGAVAIPARSAVATTVPAPTPPFWGARTVRVAPAEVFPLLDLKTLFRLHWGGRGVQGAEWERLVREEFDPMLARLQREGVEEGWLSPAAVYGYFPANGQGDELIVYDPDDHDRELARFPFPRQPRGDFLCLADYFRPVESGERDVVAFQAVTVGREADDLAEALQARGEYSDMLYIHGLSVSLAEGMAEWTHRRVRRELGLAEERGKRYSWGYPACPDTEQHHTLFRLLPAADELGMEVSSGGQLIPEQSTAALVVHHPEAKYYSTTGGAREGAATPR